MKQKNIDNFIRDKNKSDTGSKTGLDNRRPVEGSAISRMVGNSKRAKEYIARQTPVTPEEVQRQFKRLSNEKN